MAIPFYPDFFNDVFGPIMQPGSSGGFAGPSRIGYIARHTIKSEPVRIKFTFAKDGMGLVGAVNFWSDYAYLGGTLGFLPDDKRLFESHEIARAQGIAYAFVEERLDYPYESYIRIDIEGAEGEKGSLVAASVGGGMIHVYEANGQKLGLWQADYDLTLEDGTVLPAVLPVITREGRKPQLFTTVEEWRRVAQKEGISFAEAAIRYEENFSLWSRDEIWAFFEKIADVLDKQIHSLELVGYDKAEDRPNLPIYGRQWNAYIESGKGISDDLTSHIIRHALSTNAKIPGWKIVPGPMGTGGGYLFSAVSAVADKINAPHEKVIESLIVAAALGAIAFTHTHTSGRVGCVGESGVCCAMASGAVAHLIGGDSYAVENAASMALQANIGIPCDPIPGGKEFPCITRTVRAAVTAPLYAELAASGIDPLIPYHEMLLAIEHIYKTQARESLCGDTCGCCLTAAAAECRKELENANLGNLSYNFD
ncbi:MAG: L-serine ammonia-lyase, iron-sulfur-dependent, subunit alpha [Oscillospiraceae bacterium]|nr:L-serine ammonia-lyase, iron-sulfur-dependent, subunit alpha [Oscillospiraceae bacterium]